jgi:hypothetical protein
MSVSPVHVESILEEQLALRRRRKQLLETMYELRKDIVDRDMLLFSNDIALHNYRSRCVNRATRFVLTRGLCFFLPVFRLLHAFEEFAYDGDLPLFEVDQEAFRAASPKPERAAPRKGRKGGARAAPPPEELDSMNDFESDMFEGEGRKKKKGKGLCDFVSQPSDWVYMCPTRLASRKRLQGRQETGESQARVRASCCAVSATLTPGARRRGSKAAVRDQARGPVRDAAGWADDSDADDAVGGKQKWRPIRQALTTESCAPPSPHLAAWDRARMLRAGAVQRAAAARQRAAGRGMRQRP